MHDARLIFVAFFVTYGINSYILERRIWRTRQEGTTTFFLECVPSYSTRYTIEKRDWQAFLDKIFLGVPRQALLLVFIDSLGSVPDPRA